MTELNSNKEFLEGCYWKMVFQKYPESFLLEIFPKNITEKYGMLVFNYTLRIQLIYNQYITGLK